MKPYIRIVIVSFISLSILLGILINLKLSRIDISSVGNGEVRFIYDADSISKKLSQEDLDTIKEIFNGKRLYNDNPSCGFTENVSIMLDENTQAYCIACDGCSIIYWKNKNRYFSISEKENMLLREMLIKYGFRFPCV